jgi:hypothetical protein
VRFAAAVLCAALLSLAGCCTTAARVRPGEDPEKRAGYPSVVKPHARPSDDGGYVGYEVGGGAWGGKGDGPTRDQGTWGWDYVGLKFPSFVTLGWWNGKDQGGGGAYQPDGPRPIQRIERRHE